MVQKQWHRYNFPDTVAGLLSMALILAPAMAMAQQSNNPLSVPGLNSTQRTMSNVIIAACPSGNNEPQFQQRCNNIVGAALDNQSTQVLTSLQEVSPEQIIAQGTQGIRIQQGGPVTFAGAIVGLRLDVLRADTGDTGQGGLQLTLNGQPVPVTGGAAGADNGGLLGRLGVFVNVVYDFGDVDSTFRQKGFDYDIGGLTAGVDYRFTDRLVAGAAFSYLRSDLEFDDDAGSTDSDTYSGSLYGTYYVTERFFMDGIATYGRVDYDTRRRIRYTIAPNQVDPNGDVVNTTADGSPDGDQYTLSLGAGYELSRGAWTLSPYGRISYSRLEVDSYRERGGAGWAMAFEDQTAHSSRTTLGSQLSYALSLPWGVLLPQLRAEWHHEFDDDERRIGARFLGDLTTGGQQFQVLTENPDRDYFNLGLGVAATFARGLSAFVDYDALVGYQDITDHQVVVGARLEF